MELLIIFGVMVATAIVCAVIGICIESYSWHGGHCRECGGRLEFFDYDSQGGRGYKCDICDRKVWISYKCVDRKKA